MPNLPEYKGLIIVYSRDDKGYYAQDPDNDWKTSQISNILYRRKFKICNR